MKIIKLKYKKCVNTEHENKDKIHLGLFIAENLSSFTDTIESYHFIKILNIEVVGEVKKHNIFLMERNFEQRFVSLNELEIVKKGKEVVLVNDKVIPLDKYKISAKSLLRDVKNLVLKDRNCKVSKEIHDALYDYQAKLKAEGQL